MEKNKRDLSGSTLKLIAMLTMLIDHIAACVLSKVITSNPDNFDALGSVKHNQIYHIYIAMRLIGRIAFPIFIFLLIEGFKYTRNRWKYMARLFLFAFISEIPFDMAVNLNREDILSGKIVEFSSQNVFFTLAIGMLVITVIDIIANLKIDSLGLFWFKFCVAVLGMGLAFALQTDYGAVGVLAIVAAYYFRGEKEKQTVASCVILAATSLTELFALVDIIPIYFYRGRRGLQFKWLFYAFYPVHLLALAIIIYALGL